MESDVDTQAIDPKWFRQVLGQYPTGVCVVTATDADGGQAGMSVGSFTSVSLDPPLVAFFPDKASTTWPRIERAGAFCVNVLAADQEHVCRAFATKGGDKFTGLEWYRGRSGSPVIEGAIAWIDCDIEQVHEAGDHYIVIGRVRELDVANASLPLLFFQGGYGRFVPESLVTADLEVIAHFRHVDQVRHELEALASVSGVECNATVGVRDEIVIIATAGQPRGPHIPTRVGHRYAMVPPVGSLFVAWEPEAVIERWLDRATPGLTPNQRQRQRDGLDWIRRNGYSVLVGTIGRGLGPDDVPPGAPARDLRRHIRDLRPASNVSDLGGIAANHWASMSAPAFDAGGHVSLAINLYGFDEPLSPAEAGGHADRLVAAARRITELIGGGEPGSIAARVADGAAPA